MLLTCLLYNIRKTQLVDKSFMFNTVVLLILLTKNIRKTRLAAESYGGRRSFTYNDPLTKLNFPKV